MKQMEVILWTGLDECICYLGNNQNAKVFLQVCDGGESDCTLTSKNLKMHKQGNIKLLGNLVFQITDAKQSWSVFCPAGQCTFLSWLPVEFMTVAPSGPDLWLWNKQHNVAGSSAPQVNVVYRRLSTAAPALCIRPNSRGINLTFPDCCSCHKTLNFIFLSVCREVFKLLVQSSPIAECHWW